MSRTIRWTQTEPSRFRAGQVVQLEVAFRVVPTTSKHLYRMVLLIRSVALLDSELYTVSIILPVPSIIGNSPKTDLAAEDQGE